jgi:hypothetical protein
MGRSCSSWIYQKIQNYMLNLWIDFWIIVEREEKKELRIEVNLNIRLRNVRNDDWVKIQIGMGLGENVMERKKIKELWRNEEMDNVEGKILSFWLCCLVDLVQKEDSLCVRMILRMKEYFDGVCFSSLKRNNTQQLMILKNEMKKKRKSNKEMLKWLKSLLFSIIFVLVVFEGMMNGNVFYQKFGWFDSLE